MPANLHIVIACSYLHVPGGYEKAMITTANMFAGRGHKVTLLILDHSAHMYYPVDPAVQIVHLTVNFGITTKGNIISRKIRLWKDTRKLVRVLKRLQADHLICSEYHFAIAAVLGGAKKFTRVYSWEHHHYAKQEMNRFWKFLFQKYYPKLDSVICLNKDEQQYYLSVNENAVVIPNFIEPPPLVTITEEGHRGFSLISVTRFNTIKGIDLLMKVAKLILPQQPDIKWKVIGYGEQKEKFLDFIRGEGFNNQLLFQSADKTDLTDDYRDAAIFVMTSRNECFPLVLLEAMSNGLPCIAFDCDTGPRHIIHNNENGLLVGKENVQEMAAAILSLLRDSERQKWMSRNALKTIRSFYPDMVYPLWKQLFRKIS